MLNPFASPSIPSDAPRGPARWLIISLAVVSLCCASFVGGYYAGYRQAYWDAGLEIKNRFADAQP